MVWETKVSCGTYCRRHVIQVRDPLVLPASQNSFVDSGRGDLNNLTQPTISGNGDYIAFVRKSGSTQSVELYNTSTHSYSVIASSGSGKYFDPSPSDDGKKVVYLLRGSFNFPSNYNIKLYNNGITSSITNVSTGMSVVGVPIAHPHLTADGKWLTYAKKVNNTFRIKTRNLLTNLETDATTPSSPVSHSAPCWQKANP
jgi:Tol biopolymer transport system component